MKKVLVLFLTCLMVFSSVIPVFASDITTFMDGITISGDGEHVTMNPGELDNEDSLDAVVLFHKYRSLAAFLTGLMAVTAIFFLFWNISRLSTALDNEFSRRRLMIGIAVSAIAVALMGSSTVVLAFFYQFFQP